MELISDKVLHYGRFKDALDKVVDLMRSEYPSSVIIRGNPGSGKITLVEEAIRLTKVKSVFVSPEHYNDDFVAIKAIAEELEFTVRGSSVSKLMDEMRVKMSSGGEKIVIVLEDFEDLCSKRQSLLYNLMNLIHTNPTKIDKGPNLTLIGLTCNLEWAENIEKRVRSRLNAKCIDLKLPYSTLDEYVEFVSQLLGGYKVRGEFREQIEYMYWFTNRSVRSLKRYLTNICQVDEDSKKLEVQFNPEAFRDDYQMLHNNLLRERLRHLTTPQLDLVKMAVFYCYRSKSVGFTLGKLCTEPCMEGHARLDAHDSRLYRDAALLVKLRLFKPDKVEQVVGLEALMYPAVTARQFKLVVDGDNALHSTRTDALWRALR